MIKIKLHKALIFALLNIFMLCAMAQETIISGTVTDNTSGERMIGATVYEPTTRKGSTTNEYGFFTLSVPFSNNLTLAISYVGYNTFYKKITEKGNHFINCRLETGGFIEGVEIKADYIIPIERRNEMSVLRIPINQVRVLPLLGGEADILKAFQLMPGAKQGNEGSSGLLVRGGNAEQNLIIVDEVPLYNVNHLGGFVSIFNTDAIQSAELYKGGFPARYGGRLSSVLNVKLKEGNILKASKKIEIGLISGKILLEGPIIKDTSSYLITFRRFLYDLITRPISGIAFNGISSGYYFYDLNTKLNYKLGNKDWLYLSIYNGNDKVFVNSKDKSNAYLFKTKSSTEWGNMAIAFRWNHIYSNSLFGNITLSYTKYRYLGKATSISKKAGNNNESNYSFYSGISDLSLKADYEYTLNNKYRVFYGGNSILHKFTPGVTHVEENNNNVRNMNTFGDNLTYSVENSLYFENEFNVSQAINANIGLRFNHYLVEKKNYYMLEPRFLLGYSIGQNSAIKLSYSKMEQTVHMLTNDGIGMPSDLWMPTTSKIRPSYSDQFALGFAKTFSDMNYELSAELYHKKMSNLIAYSEGEGYISLTRDWEDRVEHDGSGNSFGLEILLQKSKGKSTGWFGYTLSKATRKFKNLNHGNVYPFRYDRRHEFSFVATHKISPNTDISIVWVFATGNSITLATKKYTLADPALGVSNSNTIPIYDGEDEILYFSNKNEYKMKPHHRLDIGINFRKQKKKGERTWSISIYNVYNRQNPYYYFYESDNSGLIILKQLCLFPIMPSFSYGFTF